MQQFDFAFEARSNIARQKYTTAFDTNAAITSVKMQPKLLVANELNQSFE
jgi:hypothetical protein